MSSAIEVTVAGSAHAEWFGGISHPGWFTAWETIVAVDGETHGFLGGTVHRVECAPGRHEVAVYFLGRKLQGLLGLLGIKYGLAKATIEVPEGATARLRLLVKYGWTTGLGRTELTVLGPG
jgi:hypothetical protein